MYNIYKRNFWTGKTELIETADTEADAKKISEAINEELRKDDSNEHYSYVTND